MAAAAGAAAEIAFTTSRTPCEHPNTITYGDQQQLSTWTKADIASVGGTNAIYYFVTLLLCMSVVVLTATRMFLRERRSGIVSPYTDFILAILWGCFLAAMLLSRPVLYFGIPKALTFGVQLGKILPTSCDASIAVEGPNGWPCSTKRLLEWVQRFLSNDSCYQFNEIPKRWQGVFGMLLLYLVVATLSVLISGKERKKEEKRKREGVEKPAKA